MGIPHVVVANANGKIDAFVDTWTADVAGVARATDPAEALPLGRRAR